jgi:hypothetical protein
MLLEPKNIWFGDEVEPDEPENLCEDFDLGFYPKPAEVQAW